jgi:hypothetical protein
VHDVVVWGTGNVGRPAIRSVLANPELQLTGVVVSDPAKVGRDAGELADDASPAVGVAAVHVDDAQTLLDAGPAAVVYASSADFRPAEAEDDFERILASGANLVSCSIYPLYHPPSAPEPLRTRMEAACATGGSSCFVSGIDPGFGNDLLPLILSATVQEIQQVRCQEIFNYATYHAPEAVLDICGFGSSMDQLPPMVLPSVPTMVWGPVIRTVADALGVQLDSIEEVVERLPLEETLELPIGTLQAGTQGAMRFEIQGIVDGEPRIVVEHITRITDDIAPEWPTPPGGGIGCHRVLLQGRPNVELTIASEDPGPDGQPDHNVGGIATAAGRIVHAIPSVVAAPPGLLGPLDLPLIVGRGLVATGPRT